MLVWFTMQDVSYAQYITLPDPNFAAHIAQAYPTAVNGSNQLDTNVAKTITGTFNAIAKNINDVTGIEYFKNIDKLYLTSNNLTFLPNLDRLTLLTRLEVDTNQLTTLPDLHALTSLKAIFCQYNNISVLPSMANMSSVQQYFIHRNQLTALPDITGMTSLYHFICSDNYITTLPNMSSLTSLNRFLCTNNKLTSVDLTSIPNVTEVHLRNNNLPNFPTITGMTQLTQLHVDGNKFTTLPDLSSFVNLTDVRLQNNYLTFEDLLPLITLPGFSGFSISPQKLIGTYDTILVKEKLSYTLSTGVDLSITTNTYKWFKNGVQIATSTVPNLIFSPIQFQDEGLYTFEIQNTSPLLSGLVLKSNPKKLKVISCIDLTSINFSYSQAECKSPILFSVDESTVLNAVPPLSYTLDNILSGLSITSAQSSFDVSHSGLYQLTIRDAINCTQVLSTKIDINKKVDCDPVIYPDLLGNENSFYLNQTGKAIVYSVSGIKIRELTLPAYWNGKDQQGNLVETGLYMINVNDIATISISVIRTK